MMDRIVSVLLYTGLYAPFLCWIKYAFILKSCGSYWIILVRSILEKWYIPLAVKTKNSISVKKKIYTIVGKRKREMMALFHMFSVSDLFFILENCLDFTSHLWYLNCFSIWRGPRFHLLRLYLLKTKDIKFL